MAAGESPPLRSDEDAVPGLQGNAVERNLRIEEERPSFCEQKEAKKL